MHENFYSPLEIPKPPEYLNYTILSKKRSLDLQLSQTEGYTLINKKIVGINTGDVRGTTKTDKAASVHSKFVFQEAKRG